MYSLIEQKMLPRLPEQNVADASSGGYLCVHNAPAATNTLRRSVLPDCRSCFRTDRTRSVGGASWVYATSPPAQDSEDTIRRPRCRTVRQSLQ